MRSKRSQAQGFTLIELMIVVAIIALLAAIAIPNFLAFQCRAKQAEPKASLGSLFAMEKLVFSEHNTYTTDLVLLNWYPEGTPIYIYSFGNGVFPPAGTLPGSDPTQNNTLDPAVIGTPPKYSTTRMVDLNGDPLEFDNDVPASAGCSGQTFVIGAGGDIRPDIGIGIDKWFVNDQKIIQSTENDCFTDL